MNPRLLAAAMLLAASCHGSDVAPVPVAVAAPPDLAMTAPPPPPAPTFVPMDLPRFDVHTHVVPGALPKAMGLFRAHKIVEIVNLSGGEGVEDGLADTLAEAKADGHVLVFVNPDFSEVLKGKGYGQRMAQKIAAGQKLGARGVKIYKGLGLGYTFTPVPRGTPPLRKQLVPVDDKGLDPVFETAGKLHMPVAIHTGDPKAFFQPITPENERIDELGVHPHWSFFHYPPDRPLTWDDLFSQFERLVARHPKTIFIGVHFGNDPEDPARVAKLLDAHPNLYIDTAARIPEIGRRDANHDPERMRAFFLKYQDRILFGTDTGVGGKPGELMLGSTGETPPGPDDVERFFGSTWRWFETNDKDIPSPTPIQGRWNIDGIGLPREVLEKVYYKNAERVLGVRLDEKSP